MNDSFYERYVNGDHSAVWQEMVLMKDTVRELSYLEGARKIVKEAINRIQQNVILFIPRIEDVGFVFGFQWAEDIINKEIEIAKKTGAEIYSLTSEWISNETPSLFSLPQEGSDKILRQLENELGDFPLSLHEWYSSIGSVNFVGTPPKKWIECIGEPYLLNPLWMDSLEIIIENNHYYREEHILIPAPDRRTKYRKQGGTYEIKLPGLGIDTPITEVWSDESKLFIEYMRECLQWGGFPGWKEISLAPIDDIKFITEVMIPF